jgi:hypothetical protein
LTGHGGRQVAIRLRSPQDLAAGLFLIAIAVAAYVLASDLPMGRAVRMGPGYLPTLLSWILGGLGVLVLMRAVTVDGPRLEGWAWRPVLTLTFSLLLFAALLQRAGLVVAIFAAVAVASFAAPRPRLVPVLVLCVVLATGCSALFKYVLGLPLVLWPQL